MEVKGVKGERGGKKNRRAEKNGGVEVGVKRSRLDAMSVGYFRRVSERLDEGFEDEEEKGLFMENVLSEVKGKARLTATDMTGSIALEKLLPLATAAQVGEVLAELGGDSGAEFKSVACHRCGGHVVQSALKQAHRWPENTAHGEEIEEEDCGILEVQVQRVCATFRENILDFLTDAYGSHVLRTLMQALAGCWTPDEKQKKKAQEVQEFEVPASFWWELKHLSDTLMLHINVCATNPSASAALQTLLTVCHRKRPILCRKLNKCIMGYLTSRSSALGVSPLLVFMKDSSCSHLIQKLFSLSHKALLKDVYRNHLKGNLMTLALHPIANFTAQTLLAASAPYKLVLKMLDELTQGFEAVLAAGHMGLVVQVVESCTPWPEKQGEVLQRLLEAFHCKEPTARQASCLPLFLSLLTYEMLYKTETPEGDKTTPGSLSVSYHGSRLIQALSGFTDRTLLMNSLHSLEPDLLLTIGTDAIASHALQALVTAASDKGRGKILRKMEELWVPLACSSCGSRLLEAVWSSATISQRRSIAEKLVSSENQLRSDRFARHIWAKFALVHFLKRPAAWQDIQTGQSRKRKAFEDILH